MRPASTCSPIAWKGAGDVGDLIVVLQSGADGLTASPFRFLGYSALAQVLV